MNEAAIGSRAIETACGLFIDPIDPDPVQFRLSDIGHGLGNMCRYNGACRRFYSVAEHSLWVGDLLEAWGCDDATILQGLMHDASEAYLPDLSSPLKRDGWGKGFRDAEDLLMERLAGRFGFAWPMTEEVKKADAILMWCETHILMSSGGKTWGAYEEFGRKAIEDNPAVIEWVEVNVFEFAANGIAKAWKSAVDQMGAK